MKALKRTSGIVALCSVALMATAAAPKFDFKDPKGVNTVSFALDAPLEAISGSANGISGVVEFDPADPGKTRGRIVVTAASMHVPHPSMKEHMHGKDWMDVGTHPEIVFEATELKAVKREGDVFQGLAVGKFTMKGVSKEMSIPVRLTYLKDKLGARTNGRVQGDLLVLRAKFQVKRSEFGINPGAPADKVSDEVDLTFSLAGSSPR